MTANVRSGGRPGLLTVSVLVLLMVAAACTPPEPGGGPVGDAGPYAYVAMTNLGAIRKIDTVTLDTVDTLWVDGPLGESIALGDGRIYYSQDDQWGDIGAYDLTTGVNDRSFLPEREHGAMLRTSPALPGVLFVATSLSSGRITKWDVSGPEPVELAESAHGALGGFINDFEISADGTRLWAAAGSPYELTEARTSDMALTGHKYPTGAYPQAVDSVVTADGELLAGGRRSSDPAARVFDATNPATVTAHDLNRPQSGDGGVEQRGIGFSRDGSLVFAVVEGWYESNLVTVDRSTGGITRAPMFDDSDSNSVSGRMGELAVDPGTGRVFVTATDRIAVYNPDGSFGKILTEPAPRGIVFTATGPTGDPPPLTTTTTTTTTSTSTTTTTLNSGPPVIDSFGPFSDEGPAPHTTAFGWVISDPDDTPLTCELDIGDDGTYDVAVPSCSSQSKRSVSFTDEGAHQVRLRVSDGESSVEAVASVIVTPASSDLFDIQVRFSGGATPSQQAVFDSAASGWAEVIRAGLTDVNLDLPADHCGTGAPAFNGPVDDILIDASIVPIDGPGGTLGQAGPCMVRTTGGLPAYGVMNFDSDDVAGLEASGELESVVLHEMGHVLGIGTIWDHLLFNKGTSNPYYNGVVAVGAWDEITGTTNALVPVEGTGGPGTADAHWRESVFGNELMTGWLDPGANPLSTVSVGALADLGYGVDLGRADAFGGPAAKRPTGPPMRIDTEMILPIGTVGD